VNLAKFQFSLWGFLMGVSYGEILWGFSTVLCKPMTSHASPGQPRPALAGPEWPGPAKPAQPSQAKPS